MEKEPELDSMCRVEKDEIINPRSIGVHALLFGIYNWGIKDIRLFLDGNESSGEGLIQANVYTYSYYDSDFNPRTRDYSKWLGSLF